MSEDNPDQTENLDNPNNPDQPYKRTALDYFYDGLMWVYNKFMRFVSLNDDDPIPLVFFKIFLRAVGVIIMLILSPFIIVGFIIAIMVVS